MAELKKMEQTTINERIFIDTDWNRCVGGYAYQLHHSTHYILPSSLKFLQPIFDVLYCISCWSIIQPSNLCDCWRVTHNWSKIPANFWVSKAFLSEVIGKHATYRQTDVRQTRIHRTMQPGIGKQQTIHTYMNALMWWQGYECPCRVPSEDLVAAGPCLHSSIFQPTIKFLHYASATK